MTLGDKITMPLKHENLFKVEMADKIGFSSDAIYSCKCVYIKPTADIAKKWLICFAFHLTSL